MSTETEPAATTDLGRVVWRAGDPRPRNPWLLHPRDTEHPLGYAYLSWSKWAKKIRKERRLARELRRK